MWKSDYYIFTLTFHPAATPFGQLGDVAHYLSDDKEGDVIYCSG